MGVLFNMFNKQIKTMPNRLSVLKVRNKYDFLTFLLIFVIIIQLGFVASFQSYQYSKGIKAEVQREQLEKNKTNIDAYSSEITRMLLLTQENLKFLEERGYKYVQPNKPLFGSQNETTQE